MSRTLAAVVAVAMALVGPPEARATSPTERLRGFFASATRTIEDPRPEFKLEDRMDAIRALVRDIFDIREAAKLSLGPEWSARTAEERTEFVRLFAELVERSFISGIAARIRLSDGVHVNFIDESVDGTQATVRTAIASKSGAELPFHYRMIERGQRWAVRDVVVDGVSLAANYRAQFGRILQSGSYSELIHQLRARVPGTGMVAMMVAAEDSGPAVPSPPLTAPTTTAAAPRPLPASQPSPVSLPSHLSAPTPALLPTPESLPTPVSPASISLPSSLSQSSAPPPSPVSLPSLAPTREAATVTPEPEVRPTVSIALVRSEPPQTAPAGIIPSRPLSYAFVQRSASEAAEPSSLADEERLVPGATTPLTRTSVPRAAHPRSFWVQVGAFANVETARRLASALADQEPATSRDRWVVVVESADGGAPLARVRVGPFTAWVDAASKLKDIRMRGFQSFIAEHRD
jgi:phospholipid transport system substrate-binding protein